MNDKRVPCSYCGKLTTRRYLYLSDGETLCAKCAKQVEPTPNH